MRVDDLIITVAYFSIPLQILVSLYHYPRLQEMPVSMIILAVLFSLFIFLCGAGHLLRCMHYTETLVYSVLNGVTAFISMTTALYLLPLIPSLMSSLDQNLQDLVELNAQTEESKRKLITFMAFLCHEIRNPLFIITSTISFLEEEYVTSEKPIIEPEQDGHDDERRRDNASNLALIKHSADLMLRIVNDVLDISRLESGEVELSSKDFDLRQTLFGATTSAQANIREKNDTMEKDTTMKQTSGMLELRCHIDQSVPQYVHGDPARLLQVCLNLLSNAVKFTDVGFVEFSVTRCDFHEALKNGHISTSCLPDSDSNGDDTHDEDNIGSKHMVPILPIGKNHQQAFKKARQTRWDSDDIVSLLEEGKYFSRLGRKSSGAKSVNRTVLKISVEDTGCGIPPEQLDRIFKPYTMAKLADYRTHGGTGLGLSIVSKLTGIMHGTVKARSVVGVGSVFEAYIVLEDPHLPSSFGGNDDSTVATSLDASMYFASTNERFDNSDLSNSLKVMCLPPPPLSPSPKSSPQSSMSLTPPKVDHLLKTDIPPQKRATLSKFGFAPNEAVVLVVDDNVMNQKLLGRMLKSFNLESRQARNGQEAVEAMLKSRNYTNDQNDPNIRLILMDLSMPVMDGCEASAKIRSLGLRDVPIMALTAAAIDEDKEKAMKAGVTDYSTKPILREDLHSKCVQYLTPLPPPVNLAKS